MTNTEGKVEKEENVKSVQPLKSERIRESGIELFRIITMILIVAHHYVVNSGIMALASAKPLSLPSLFLFLFGGWGKTGINCFVLITGYFMCKSRITTKKFLKLLLEVEFYKILFYAIFLISGYEPFSFTGLVKSLLPIASVGTNFTGCYLLFYLTIPFLNILIRNMTERQHVLLVVLLLFIYTILGTLPKFSVTMNYVTWFIVLYFISSYIRCYPKKIFESKKVWGLSLLAITLISALSIVACTWLGTKTNSSMTFYFVSDSNRILALATGVCAFMFFKNLTFKSKFINTIAASTFGVLLIHANSDVMRRWLWKDLLNVQGMYSSVWLPVHAVGSVLAIFAVCTLIDFLRLQLLEKPFIKFFHQRFEAIDRYIAGENKRKEESL